MIFPQRIKGESYHQYALKKRVWRCWNKKRLEGKGGQETRW